MTHQSTIKSRIKPKKSQNEPHSHAHIHSDECDHSSTPRPHSNAPQLFNPCPNIVAFLFFTLALILIPLVLQYGHHPSQLFQSSQYTSNNERLLSEDALTLCPFEKIRIATRDVILCANSISFEDDGVHESIAHGEGASEQMNNEEIAQEVRLGEASDKEGSVTTTAEHQKRRRRGKKVKILFLHDVMTDHSFLYQMQLSRVLSHAKKENIHHFQMIYFDWRGCGMSLGHAAHMQPHVKDLKVVWEKYEMGEGTTFVVANGLGALLFAEFERRYTTNVDGVILSGVPLVLGRGFMTQNPNNKWVPPKHLVKKPVIAAISALLPYFPVVNPPIDWLVSSNTPTVPPPTERAREKYALDRFVPARITAGIMNVWRESVRHLKLRQLPWKHVLILHATDDPVASPVSAQALYNGLKAKDKTVKMIEAEHHNILHEEGVDEYVADWIRERI